MALQRDVRLVRRLLGLIVLTLVLASCALSDDTGSRAETSVRGTVGEATVQKTTAAASPVEGVSVREMVGQMFVVSVGGTAPDYYIKKMVRERNVGGVILFGYNMRGKRQVASLAGSLQDLSMRTEPAVPLFVAVDQEGGEVSSAPWAAPQPAAATVGRRGDPAQARTIAEKIGTDLLGAGVNTNLAPVVDTGFGAAIGSRSYGEDPELVAEMGAAAVEGYEDAGIVAAAKHFPNHGPATVDSHEGLPVVGHDRRTVETFDLPPFRAAVEAGVPMVMMGHLLYPVVDPERPASLAPEAYRMLREDLGFDGVAVTDDLAMEGATGGGPPSRAAVRAVVAGADLLVISSAAQEQADAYDAVVAAVRSGEIREEQVRDSVRRILEVKRRYGLRARFGY